MPGIGKTLVGLGFLIMLVGGLYWVAEGFFGKKGGSLPGDLFFRKGNVTFAFPLASGLLLSLILTVLLNLLIRFFGRIR